MQQQQQKEKEEVKKNAKPEQKSPAPDLRASGGVKKMSLREIQEEELRELQKRKEVEGILAFLYLCPHGIMLIILFFEQRHRGWSWSNNKV